MASIWAVGVSVFLASAALAVYLLSRAVASRRLNAAADAYARRELAQQPRGPRS